MGILKVYAEIMDEAPKLKSDYGLDYHAAIRKAKEMYKEQLKEKTHNSTDQSKSYELDTKTTETIIPKQNNNIKKAKERYCNVALTENQVKLLDKFLGFMDIDDTEIICKKYYLESDLYAIESILYDLWEQIHKNIEINKFIDRSIENEVI